MENAGGVIMNHIFGPVPSRRLGQSLGVDVIPYKTCSYDCIYCQLGPTTRVTIERKSFVPVGAVLDELETVLREGCRPDYVTLSGSGEPTLYAELGALIAGIKARTEIPVVLLTNGSLLWDAAARADACRADLVIPSLDAGDATLFRCINRPHPCITFEQMLEGLVALRADYTGPIWLEVMLLAGMTAIRAEVEKINAHIARIRPDRVQVNTAVRPPAQDFAFPAPAARLEQLAELFEPRAEVICERLESHQTPSASATRGDIIDLLARRPCSLEDIAQGLGMHPNEVLKHLDYLAAQQSLRTTLRNGKRYYAIHPISSGERTHRHG
jgi:wyosine [tRNA(Phe)-imidazoG37] synthetase (radical SAM superfamily)